MKRAIRFLSYVVIVGLMIQCAAGWVQARAAGSAAADHQVYSDVQNHWAQAAIEKWSDLGILQGSGGQFRPDDAVTRGEMAVVLDRIMHYGSAAPNTFSDLGQAYYADAVLKANAAGVILGSGGLIRPTDILTREEAAVVLARALGIRESAMANGFSDSAAISRWALGYVNAMSAKGYIRGANGTFSPKAVLTRAALAAILDNAIAALDSEAKTYSADTAGMVVINTPGVTLKDMKITGDLLISQGVGSGDVTLDHVTVTGNTIVRGGGAGSVHIAGGSQLSNLIIEKTDSGTVRVVTADGAAVNAVLVDDGRDDVILTGAFTSVTVAADVAVSIVGAAISDIKITDGHAALSIDAQSTVTELTASETAKGAAVTVAGTVGALTANAQITVKNSGAIKAAAVNADSVVIDGNTPSGITIGSKVTIGPRDGSGKDLSGGPAVFAPATDSSIVNDIPTLGLVGIQVVSNDASVAAASISAGKIIITSVSAGTATLIVTDSLAHQASIVVTVAPGGSITVVKITKYSVAGIRSVSATNGTVTIVLTSKPAVAPVRTDFSATRSINGSAASALALANFSYDGNTTVTFTFTPIPQAASAQIVYVTVTMWSETQTAPLFAVGGYQHIAANFAYVACATYNLRFVNGVNYYDYSVYLNGATKPTVITALDKIWPDFTSGLYAYTVDFSGYVCDPVETPHPDDGTAWKVTVVDSGFIGYTDGTQNLSLTVDANTRYYQVNPVTHIVTEAPIPLNAGGPAAYITYYARNTNILGDPALYVYYVVK